jgi:hypothetical protein
MAQRHSASIGIFNFIRDIQKMLRLLNQRFLKSLSPSPRSVFLCVEIDTDTREGPGWPLLTVETEANGDSWSTYEKSPRWFIEFFHRAGIRDVWTALAVLIGAPYIFSSPHTTEPISLNLPPNTHQAGRSIVLHRRS